MALPHLEVGDSCGVQEQDRILEEESYGMNQTHIPPGLTVFPC